MATNSLSGNALSFILNLDVKGFTKAFAEAESAYDSFSKKLDAANKSLNASGQSVLNAGTKIAVSFTSNLNELQQIITSAQDYANKNPIRVPVIYSPVGGAIPAGVSGGAMAAGMGTPTMVRPAVQPAPMSSGVPFSPPSQIQAGKIPYLPKFSPTSVRLHLTEMAPELAAARLKSMGIAVTPSSPITQAYTQFSNAMVGVRTLPSVGTPEAAATIKNAADAYAELLHVLKDDGHVLARLTKELAAQAKAVNEAAAAQQRATNVSMRNARQNAAFAEQGERINTQRRTREEREAAGIHAQKQVGVRADIRTEAIAAREDVRTAGTKTLQDIQAQEKRDISTLRKENILEKSIESLTAYAKIQNERTKLAEEVTARSKARTAGVQSREDQKLQDQRELGYIRKENALEKAIEGLSAHIKVLNERTKLAEEVTARSKARTAGVQSREDISTERAAFKAEQEKAAAEKKAQSVVRAAESKASLAEAKAKAAAAVAEAKQQHAPTVELEKAKLAQLRTIDAQERIERARMRDISNARAQQALEEKRANAGFLDRMFDRGLQTPETAARTYMLDAASKLAGRLSGSDVDVRRLSALTGQPMMGLGGGGGMLGLAANTAWGIRGGTSETAVRGLILSAMSTGQADPRIAQTLMNLSRGFGVSAEAPFNALGRMSQLGVSGPLASTLLANQAQQFAARNARTSLEGGIAGLQDILTQGAPRISAMVSKYGPAYAQSELAGLTRVQAATAGAFGGGIQGENAVRVISDILGQSYTYNQGIAQKIGIQSGNLTPEQKLRRIAQFGRKFQSVAEFNTQTGLNISPEQFNVISQLGRKESTLDLQKRDEVSGIDSAVNAMSQAASNTVTWLDAVTSGLKTLAQQLNAWSGGALGQVAGLGQEALGVARDVTIAGYGAYAARNWWRARGGTPPAAGAARAGVANAATARQALAASMNTPAARVAAAGTAQAAMQNAATATAARRGIAGAIGRWTGRALGSGLAVGAASTGLLAPTSPLLLVGGIAAGELLGWGLEKGVDALFGGPTGEGALQGVAGDIGEMVRVTKSVGSSLGNKLDTANDYLRQILAAVKQHSPTTPDTVIAPIGATRPLIYQNWR